MRTISAAGTGTTRTMKSPVTTWMVSGGAPAALAETRMTTPTRPSGPSTRNPSTPAMSLDPDRGREATTSGAGATTSGV